MDRMYVLGLNHDMYISSAALLADGKIVAAAAEERFTREKHTRAFPQNAVRFCLEKAGIGIEDVDHVATGWNPGAYMINFNPLVSAQRRSKSEYLYAVPDNLLALFPENSRRVDHVHQRLVLDGVECSVYHVTHHRAHAANAFLLSPFEEAAILTMDSQGERESTTFGMGRGHTIEIFDSQEHPHSLGAFYATFTEFLGFRPNRDEWKVMALGGFSETGGEDLAAQLRSKLVTLRDDGTFALDLTYFQDFLHEVPHHYSPRMEAAFGPARTVDTPLDERHFCLAAAVQTVAEEVALNALRALHRRTGSKAVCVAGGFFMNSVLNGKILAETPFEHLFVSSCPDDSGNAMGAAYYLFNQILGRPERHALEHNFLGPDYSDVEIETAIRRSGLEPVKHPDIVATTADALAEGKLVGWFQGAMEFGQRALGNRSILANPCEADARDKVNAAVKFREAFRPFAPAVPLSRAPEYFDLVVDEPVPFMERVVQARPEQAASIPAVIHVDGSARVQTVDAESNPRFHALLEAFGERTGVPVLLNTSFNLNNEPIVASPQDAIRSFFSCGLDLLVLGDYLLDKGRNA